MGLKRKIALLLVSHMCLVLTQEVIEKPDFSKIIKTVQTIKDISKGSNGFQTARENSFMASFRQETSSRVEEILASDWKATNYNVSHLCLLHTEMILNRTLAGDQWALRMIDSMGKPPSGLLEFNLMWPGNFDECVNTEVAITGESGISTHPFSTQYCLAMLSLGGSSTSIVQTAPKITIGMCVPKSCSNEDVGALTNTLLSLIPTSIINTTDLPPAYGYCKTNGDLDLHGKQIFVIVICSFFLTAMILATFFDLYIVYYLKSDNHVLPSSQPSSNGYGSMGNGRRTSEDTTPLLNGSQTFYQNGVSHTSTDMISKTETYKPGTLAKVLLAFSVYTNARKLLNVSQPSGTLTAINGVRFISMLWVILGHTYAFGINTSGNAATYLPSMLKRLSFQVISNATVAVDTFFVLSGLLVAYLALKEMKKRGGARQFKWGMYYFHRFWRLTPPYMLFLMFYVPLIKYWIKGPFAPEGGVEFNECSDSWWKNLLYINNLYDDPVNLCMGWSWYLSNDMQFYILSPLMLIPLYYSPLWGAVSCLLFIATGTITTGAVSKHYEASSNAILGANTGDSFTHIYIKPWCRVAPYAAGIYTGYLLYKYDCKCKMSRVISLVGWIIATVVALLVLYGLYDPDGGSNMSVDMAALYNATFRLAWGLSICWVVFACATGNGGPINTLLSWKGIIPLSRLTYCAYLVHPVVMYIYYFNLRTPMYWYDLEITYLFLAHACLAYAAAFVVSLAFESPMMGLEKALLGREKNS